MQDQLTEVRGPRSWAYARVEQIKSLILELGRERRKLSCDIEAEETRAGISDPNHYAYSPLAKALRDRCNRLDQSIESLVRKLEDI